MMRRPQPVMKTVRIIKIEYQDYSAVTTPVSPHRYMMRANGCFLLNVDSYRFQRRHNNYFTFSTAGGVQVPLRIEGSFSFGQYMRSIAMKSPFGAGSQLASLSAPGDSF